MNLTVCYSTFPTQIQARYTEPPTEECHRDGTTLDSPAQATTVASGTPAGALLGRLASTLRLRRLDALAELAHHIAVTLMLDEAADYR